MDRLCILSLLCSMLASHEYVGGADPDRVDRLGDPLPKGAVTRLGTSRLRTTAIAMALGDDGKTVLTLSGGRTLGVRDIATGRLRNERYLLGPHVRGRCWFSPDGRWVAVPEHKKLRVWDTKNGKVQHTFQASVTRARFSPNHRFLATSGYLERKARVRLWDLATGKDRLLATLPSYANDVLFSPDTKQLFAAVDNHSIRCWDVESGRQLWQNDHWPSNLAISPDGRTLCADSYRRGPLILWDAKTGERIATLGEKDNGTSQIVFSPGGRYLAEATWSDGVILWEVATRKILRRFESAGPRVLFTLKGDSLISMGATLQRWNIQTRKPMYADTRALGHVGRVTAVRFSPMEKHWPVAGTTKRFEFGIS